MTPILASPGSHHRGAFLRLYARYAAADMQEWCGMNALALTDFDAYVEHLRNEAAGIGVDPEWAPTSHFWLQLGDELVGTLRIRHHLTPLVEARAGHMGYDISPPHRGKGYGFEIARLGLIEARKLGIRDVLAVCDESNLASRKILERHGGVIDRSHEGEVWYWLRLSGIGSF